MLLHSQICPICGMYSRAAPGGERLCPFFLEGEGVPPTIVGGRLWVGGVPPPITPLPWAVPPGPPGRGFALTFIYIRIEVIFWFSRFFVSSDLWFKLCFFEGLLVGVWVGFAFFCLFVLLAFGRSSIVPAGLGSPPWGYARE
jgi:hypothetical protein